MSTLCNTPIPISPRLATADEADVVGRKIVDTYLAPDKTFIEIREMLADGSIDILGKFGDVCRAEFESLRAQQF
jgi:hypothetical protein